MEKVVLDDLQRVMKLARMNERKFAERLNAASQKENERRVQRARSEYTKSKTRIAALDRIISKIYEDNVEGKMSDERFQTMLAGYESEQSELKVKAAELESLISEATVQTTNIESFLKLVRSRTEVTELTTEIVHEFIKRIEVSEAEYTQARFSHWAKGKTQEVRIIYNYLEDISKTFKDE